MSDTIAHQILAFAETARAYLDGASRRKVIRFVRSRWNTDGGVRGRDERSDLYYTVFGALCLKTLGGRIPLLRVWRYLKSFGDGAELDPVHMYSLIRLRTMFPISPTLRNQLTERLQDYPAESPYDIFFKVISAEHLNREDRPTAQLLLSASQTTPNLAAAVVVNQNKNEEAKTLLMERFCPESGGFSVSPTSRNADLLSTATALFALTVLKADMEPIREKTFEFIESIWREDGGFSGCTQDVFEDVEYTFYALLGIGCLMK
ncbi:MAG: hypothetical protein JXR23_04395 [Pontiellaceae bacterium]|nr:hypothetical protein [Pontiellaceae bacterium]